MRVSHASLEPKPNRTRLTAVLVAVVVVIAIAIFALIQPGAPVADPSVAPTASASPTATTPQATPSPVPTATTKGPAGCTAVTEGFVPTRFTIERFGVDEPVIALDLDENGSIAAPPKDEPRMASWWSGGPQPGADKGKAVLSIHTYRNGNALGNELFLDGKSQFQPGDVLKLHGDDGQVMCYGYTDSLKLDVADYDPDSDVMVDFAGDPSLTIIICWDFEKSTEIWHSRVFFNFVPIAV